MTQTIAAPRDVIAGEIAEIKGRNRTFSSDHDEANSIFLALAQAGYRIVRDEPPPAHAMGSEEGEGFVRGFMCLTDYDFELGLAEGGNTVYPSIEGLKEGRKCVASCGIVEVYVRAARIVQPAAEYEEVKETTNGE